MILDDIPVKLETMEVMKSLKLGTNTPAAVKKIAGLIEAITPVMKPKAAYAQCTIKPVDQDKITIDDQIFNSKVLVKNLSDQASCYPYVVTAGHELNQVELQKGQSVMLLDLIKNVVVEQAFQYTKAVIAEQYGLSKVTVMSPGHLDDWPLPEQRALFSLLGSDVQKIGVKLTDSYLMVPLKTVSGILFTTETGFQSCQVCLQPRCMGRRAAYDPVVAKNYGL